MRTIVHISFRQDRNEGDCGRSQALPGDLAGAMIDALGD